jgi:hypothetical protein
LFKSLPNTFPATYSQNHIDLYVVILQDALHGDPCGRADLALHDLLILQLVNCYWYHSNNVLSDRELKP